MGGGHQLNHLATQASAQKSGKSIATAFVKQKVLPIVLFERAQHGEVNNVRAPAEVRSLDKESAANQRTGVAYPIEFRWHYREELGLVEDPVEGLLFGHVGEPNISCQPRVLEVLLFGSLLERRPDG